MAERPALGAVPLGVVPFVVADGIVKTVRRNETGKPSSVRDGNCSDVWPMQMGRIFGREGAGEKKKWLTANETGIARTKEPRGFEDWMSRETSQGEESRRWEEGGQSAECSAVEYLTEQAQEQQMQQIRPIRSTRLTRFVVEPTGDGCSRYGPPKGSGPGKRRRDVERKPAGRVRSTPVWLGE